MIGRIVECNGTQIIQTLAGATAGTVCKVGYDSNQDYALPLVLNELGEGHVGISCDATICGPTYNPVTGVLKVCCVEADLPNAECACTILANGSSASTNYNLAFWGSTADGCYCPLGFSSSCAITYNPGVGVLTISGDLRATNVCATQVITDTVASTSSLCLNGCGGGITIETTGNVDINNHCLNNVCTANVTHLCLGESAAAVVTGQFVYRGNDNLLYPTDCITMDNGTTCIENLTVGCTLCANGTAHFSSDVCSGNNWCIGNTGAACFNCEVTACGGFVGNASSSTITSGMCYTGWGDCAVTAWSTNLDFEGCSGYANYLLFSHGCGSTCYGQAIRMPFRSSPQYFRREGTASCGAWYDFITSENILSQTVCYACMLRSGDFAIVKAECSNELNTYTGSGMCEAWINNRGGASVTKIGDGGSAARLGTLRAKYVCGDTCIYSNGSAVITECCLPTYLRDCSIPEVYISGNTLVLRSR